MIQINTVRLHMDEARKIAETTADGNPALLCAKMAARIVRLLRALEGADASEVLEALGFDVLKELKAREDAKGKSSNPGRFAEHIQELRRDLSLFDDGSVGGELSVEELNDREHERSKIYQELQDAIDERNADVGEDVARERHAKAMHRRGPKGGFERETWGDEDE